MEIVPSILGAGVILMTFAISLSVLSMVYLLDHFKLRTASATWYK